ncbi:MAG: hypothetical protein ACRDLR_01570, partial [Gaiellaceae bacterium]
PGHPGLIEYFDNAVVGIVLMLVLWFRPQGVVPERLRRAASFGVGRGGPGADDPDLSVGLESAAVLKGPQ